MVDNMTIIRNPVNQEEKKFSFDLCFWSHDGFETKPDGLIVPNDPKYHDQRSVFEGIGRNLLTSAFKGFNCSLFTYGQTGSGKSYSMVGYGVNKGIVPIMCDELFKYIDNNPDKEKVQEHVTLSMLEVYNETVLDLLRKKPISKGGLKVRQHPKLGVQVVDLTECVVKSYKEIEKRIEDGTSNRTVAFTQMNATSSRAHTVVAIKYTKVEKDGKGPGKDREITSSKIDLVDLAGSERAESSGTEGDRLKEGAAINLSLTMLGNVIKALAERSNNPKANIRIPYRESKLTLILQDALGGNSKTVMLATLSPADINYEETLSTLRYADRARQIKNKTISSSSTPNLESIVQDLELELSEPPPVPRPLTLAPDQEAAILLTPDQETAAFHGMLRCTTSLCSLRCSLTSDEGTGEVNPSLITALSTSTTVASLNLDHDSIGEAGAEHLARALGVNSSITLLDLRGNSIGDAGAAYLASALATNRVVATVSLADNSIGVPGVSALAEALRVQGSPVTDLDLSNNQIGFEGARVVLEALASGGAVRSLNMSKSQIEDAVGLNISQDLDMSLYALGVIPSSLTSLDISDNSIRYVPPDSFLPLHQLSVLKAARNRLVVPPAEVVDQGPSAVRSFLNRVRTEGVVLCQTAKMMIVGIAEAGKTSLVAALVNEAGREGVPADRSEAIGKADRTVGIVMQRWRPREESRTLASEASGRTVPDMTVNVLDLAGQVEYAPTHQMFLSARALYALVFDVSGFTPSTLGDTVDLWLESIQAKSPGAHVVLVATHTGLLGAEEVDKRCDIFATHVAQRLALMQRFALSGDLKGAEGASAGDSSVQAKVAKVRQASGEMCPKVIGLMPAFASASGEVMLGGAAGEAVLRVDCLSGDGVKEARSAIMAALAALPQIGFFMPTSFKTVLSFVEGLSSQGQVVHRLDKLYEAFGAWVEGDAGPVSVSREGFREAIKFWHDIGNLYVFQDLVFPNPTTVFELIRAVVMHEEEFRKISLDPALRDDMDELLLEGRLSQRLLREVLLPRVEHLFEEALWPTLIDLLDRDNFGVLYRVAVPAPSSAPSLPLSWIVPALLRDSGALPPHLPPLAREAISGGKDAYPFVRHLTLPFAPFGFILRVHTEVQGLDRLTSHLGSTWGVVRDGERSAVYYIDKVDSVFPGAQTQPSVVGRNALREGEARFVVSLKADDLALMEVVERAIDHFLESFPGLLRVVRRWVPTPLVDPADLASYNSTERWGGFVSIRALLPVVLGPGGGAQGGGFASETFPFPCAHERRFKVRDLLCPPPPEVFVSYQWDKQPEVRAIRALVEGSWGYRCWFDEAQLQPGHNLPEKMASGIGPASCVLACVTRAYVFDSPNCLFEFETAMAQGKPILPVFLDELPGTRILLATSKGSKWTETQCAAYDEVCRWRADPELARSLKVLREANNTFFIKGVGLFFERGWAQSFADGLKSALETTLRHGPMAAAEDAAEDDDDKAKTLDQDPEPVVADEGKPLNDNREPIPAATKGAPNKKGMKNAATCSASCTVQ